MPNKMHIVLDDLEPYQKTYALWSILFVQVDDIYFPSPRWRDATSAVLSIWLQETIRMIAGIADCVRLPFMDGDFEIMLTRLERESISAEFVKSEAIVVWEGKLDIRFFARQLLSTVGKLKAYYANNLDSPQMKELSSLADKLRIALKNEPG